MDLSKNLEIKKQVRSIALSFILATSLSAKSFAENTVDLKAPQAIAANATLQLSLSPRYVKAVSLQESKSDNNRYKMNLGHSTPFVTVYKCGSDDCHFVISDLSRKAVSLDVENLSMWANHQYEESKEDVFLAKKNQLRPGTYEIKLFGGLSTYRVDLKNNDKFEIPIVEIYLPVQGPGTIYANLFAHSTEGVVPYKKEQIKSYLVVVAKKAYLEFPMNLGVTTPPPENNMVKWQQKYFKDLCTALTAEVSLQSQFPQASARCEQVLEKDFISLEDFQFIFTADMKQTNFKSLKMLELAESNLFAPKGFETPKSIEISSNVASLITSSTLSSEENVALLPPGKYTVEYENESGESATQVIQISPKSKQVVLRLK